MNPPAERLVLAPAAPRVARPRQSWWSRTLDVASTYLPLLLMALLAGGTYWLVKNTPVPDGPRVEVAPRHEPDYVMNNFAVQHFTPAGRPTTFLEGTELRHYPDDETLEIDQVRVRSVDEQGRVVVATARRGLSNQDGSEVKLIGQAHVVREAGGPPGQPGGNEQLEFLGEFLHVYTNAQRVVSDQPVLLKRGTMEVRAQTLHYDHEKQVLELKGQVRGMLPPKSAAAGAAPAQPSGAQPS